MSGNHKKSTHPVRLEDFRPFQNFSETSKSVLSHGLRYVSSNKTTTVLTKGQQISGAYFVVSGQLRVYTLTPEGNEATLYFINPGETCVLALNCIFNDLLYPAWVEAKPSTTIAVISGDAYRILFESESSIRNMTVQAFSGIVFRLMNELEQIHSYKLEHRLVKFLIQHSTGEGVIHMTQQEIGSHLGATREVVARLLSGLVKAGYVQTKRNLVLISDRAKFSGLVNPHIK